MKAILVSTLVLLFGAANALPSGELDRRDDPQHTPVTIKGLPNVDFHCAGRTYPWNQVSRAIQWGVLLQEAGQARGRKDREHPNGRFPHSFTANKGPALDFPAECPDNDDQRQEFPLVKNGHYNGSPNNNVKWGRDRVVYFHEPGEVDYQGNDVATFCGVMTHDGAAVQGGFVMCTW